MASLLLGIFAWLGTVAGAVRSTPAFIGALLFAYPFLPRYVGIGVGAEDLALSFRRIVLITALIYVAVRVMASPTVRSTRVQRIFFLLFLTTIVISSLQGLINGYSNAIVFRAIENTSIMIVGLFVGSRAVQRLGWPRLLEVCFVWPLAVILPITFAEGATQSSIFFDVFGTNAYSAELGAKAYRVREEYLRAQASFDGPLQLSEYLVLSLPALLFLVRLKFTWLRLIFLSGTYLAIYLTGSRTGLLMASVLTILHVGFSFVQYKRSFRRFAISSSVVGVLLATALLLAYYISSFERVDSFPVLETSEERSTYSRLLQYQVVFDLLKHQPLFGVGYMRNIAIELDITLDNHYLWMLLEGGLTSLLCFLAMLAIVLRLSTNLTRASNDLSTFRVGLALVEFFVAFTLQKLFLQSPANFLYFFVFAGALFALPRGRAKPVRHTHVTASSEPNRQRTSAPNSLKHDLRN